MHQQKNLALLLSLLAVLLLTSCSGYVDVGSNYSTDIYCTGEKVTDQTDAIFCFAINLQECRVPSTASPTAECSLKFDCRETNFRRMPDRYSCRMYISK